MAEQGALPKSTLAKAVGIDRTSDRFKNALARAVEDGRLVEAEVGRSKMIDLAGEPS